MVNLALLLLFFVRLLLLYLSFRGNPKIRCPDAKSINLVYDSFWLPEGATLHIYDKSKNQVLGAFTNKNNKGTRNKNKGFISALIRGDLLVLEYFEPKAVFNKGVISISSVVHGYRKINNLEFHPKAESLGGSGGCQVNINCEEGVNWQDEKTSVALIVVDRGTRWCTGSLVNNTSQDGKLYFLTADHCLRGLDAARNPDASHWLFYWDYESKNCKNPTIDIFGNIPSTSGATLVANDSRSDFALFRL